MGAINIGNQILTFQYRSEATSERFNRLTHEVLDPGIYSGGAITKVSDIQIEVAPFVCLINDDTNNTQIRGETQDIATISVDNTATFIIARFAWDNTINNYMDILAVTKANIQAGDLILGRLDYDGVTLNPAVDYTEKTLPLAINILDPDVLRVTSQDPYDNTVRIGAGKVLMAGAVVDVSAQDSPTFDVPIGSNGRIDLVSLTPEGAIDIKKGNEVLPLEKPSTPPGYLPLAYIHFEPNTSIVKGSYIESIEVDIIFNAIEAAVKPGTIELFLTKERGVITINEGSKVAGLNDTYLTQGDYLFFSSNKANITPPVGVTNNFNDVLYHNDKWYLVGEETGVENYAVVYQSLDFGKNWSKISTNNANQFSKSYNRIFHWKDDEFVGLTTDGLIHVFSNIEANVFSVANPGLGNTVLLSFTYRDTDGTALVGGETGAIAQSTSVDLAGWTVVTPFSTFDLTQLSFGTTHFTVLAPGDSIYSSLDGIIWNNIGPSFGTATIGTDAKLQKIVDTTHIYIFDTNTSEFKEFTSTDGNSYTQLTAFSQAFHEGETDPIYLYYNSYFYAFGPTSQVTVYRKDTDTDWSKGSFFSQEFSDRIDVGEFSAITTISVSNEVFITSIGGFNKTGIIFDEGVQEIREVPYQEGVVYTQDFVPTLDGGIILVEVDSSGFITSFKDRSSTQEVEILNEIVRTVDGRKEFYPETLAPLTRVLAISGSEQIIENVEEGEPNYLFEIDGYDGVNYLRKGVLDPLHEFYVSKAGTSIIDGTEYIYSISGVLQTTTPRLEIKLKRYTDAFEGWLNIIPGSSNRTIISIDFDGVDTWYAITSDNNIYSGSLHLDSTGNGGTAVDITASTTDTAEFVRYGNGIWYYGFYGDEIPNLTGSILTDIIFSPYDDKFYVIDNNRDIYRSADLSTYEYLGSPGYVEKIISPVKGQPLPVFTIIGQDGTADDLYSNVFITSDDFYTYRKTNARVYVPYGTENLHYSLISFKNHILFGTMEPSPMGGMVSTQGKTVCISNPIDLEALLGQ